eukprot:CAMPEP_0196584748 /NCGR_PEP_ID=MMETSP1081-20130531/48342_1 /TAXON_ID=36882 /ORGANISM="Pyramimonas amylifera, Strain CCMP720" /LENGTH=99 /DNA_ID=CAMNT_0041906071 /DNA_START=137 /DNA_END=436 /DNA_ORIENTATION=+
MVLMTASGKPIETASESSVAQVQAIFNSTFTESNYASNEEDNAPKVVDSLSVTLAGSWTMQRMVNPLQGPVNVLVPPDLESPSDQAAPISGVKRNSCEE